MRPEPSGKMTKNIILPLGKEKLLNSPIIDESLP
jgi:hypothetical protein